MLQSIKFSRFNLATSFLKSLIICLMVSGPLYVLSEFFDLFIFRTLDELFLVLFTTSVFLHQKKTNWKFIFLICILFTVALLFLITSEYKSLVFYQLRLDIPVVILVTTTLAYFQKWPLGFNKIYSYLISTIILFGILNSIFCAAENLLFRTILAHLNISFEGFLSYGAMRISTHLGNLRAPGLLSYFVECGDFIVLAAIVTNFFPNNRSKTSSILINLMLCAGIYFTTYKNSYLGILFIFFQLFLFNNIKKNKHYGKISLIISLTIFFISFIGVNTYIIHDLVKPLSPKLAKHSIEMRVRQNHFIYSEFSNNPQKILFGLDYGLHGNFGIDKTKIVRSETISVLDSTYIYLLSNYGVIGVLFYILALFLLQARLSVNGRIGAGLSIYLCYLTSIIFFFNNFIASYPSILVFPILVVGFYYNQEKRHNNQSIENLNIQ